MRIFLNLSAAKRVFPFGGRASDKTWTMILPDPDFHRAYLNRGPEHNAHLNLKLLISYLPGSTVPLVKPEFNGKQEPPRVQEVSSSSVQTNKNNKGRLIT